MTTEISKRKLYAFSAGQGCLTNLLETTSIRSGLNPELYERADNADEADVIVVNTCGYNSQAEANSLRTITDFERRYPGKKVIVSGCLPRINPQALRESFGGDIVRTGDWYSFNRSLDGAAFDVEKMAREASGIDPDDLKTRLSSNRQVEKLQPWLSRTARLLGRTPQPLYNAIDSLAFDDRTYAISVARGCLGRCTYCAIKKAKGRLVSRPLPEIVETFQKALAQGYQKFHLVADDVGCWGQDLGLNSAMLLEALLKHAGRYRIVINYFDPTWLTRLFSQLQGPLADPRITCLNVPMQSGSNSVLKSMERDYAVTDVLTKLAEVKRRNPTLTLKTHLMVGYPGETAQDFRESLAILRTFDLIFPNRFSPRPNTPAASLPQLPDRVIDARFRRLKWAIHLRHLGVAVSSLVNPAAPIRMEALPCPPTSL